MVLVNQIVTSVEPKVMEPYDPIPGRVPRKVAIERKRKEFKNISLEEVLQSLVFKKQQLIVKLVDFNTQDKKVEWLPLEYFDDAQFDDNSVQDWIERTKDEENNFHPLSGKALRLFKQDSKRYYCPCLVDQFEQNEGLFKCRWVDTEDEFETHRIFICFDAEDPRKYAFRLMNAFRERIYADSLIRYNHFIDHMPEQDLSELDTEQKKRIESSAKCHKLSDMDTISLISEVNKDFQRTMNKIIFETFLEEQKGCDFYPTELKLPPKGDKKDIPYFGMIELEKTRGIKEKIILDYRKVQFEEPKDFTDTFKDFCFASLYIKKEVIKALQEIRVECNKILDQNILHTTLEEPMHLDQFKHIQESAVSSLTYLLKGSWIESMIKIIKFQFSEVGKGWFNMKETSKITYDFGKLKRFLTVVRLMMQDSLQSLVQRSYTNYYVFICNFIPDSVKIINSYTIENRFEENRYARIWISSAAAQRDIYLNNQISNPWKNIRKALFQLDMLKTSDDKSFIYSSKDPIIFVKVVLHAFDKGLEEIGKVPDLEPKILQDLYKSSKLETFIKAPMKPREEPIKPNPETRPRKYPDENTWIWEMHKQLEQKMLQAIAPLDDYMKSFDPYLPILGCNAEEYCKSIEMEENPREMESIREEIFQVYKKKAQLEQLIPASIKVSCFEINCKEILSYLESKLDDLAKNLKMVIAKRGREKFVQVFNEFTVIRNKIAEDPQTIEKLSEIKDYMNNVPNELEKLKIEMSKGFEIYEVLEEFNWRFSIDDLNRRWNVFAAPRELYKLMEERKKSLEKLQEKFKEDMKIQQEDFKETFNNLEQTISNFHNYQDINAHEDIAKIVVDIQTNLNEFIQNSKRFNDREHLFEIEPTDYSKLFTMQKDFAPYQSLWGIVSTWKSGSKQWKFDPLETVDAVFADKFVDEGSKTLIGIIRFMKDRGITQVQKIAEMIKHEIDEFKPQVPLLVALRKKGMNERHWALISEKVGFDCTPKGAETTFSNIYPLLMKHVGFIVDIGEKAAKEYNIEIMLNEMANIWDTINFNLLNYKDTYIIKGYDDIQMVLDEHIVSTQAMLFSPFKKPFEARIIEWDQQLKTISDVLEELGKFQANWMYLQPIFDSVDIAKQLPQEAKKFKTIDSTWKNTLSQTKQIMSVRVVCIEDGLFDKLKEANKTLEIIQKELNNYLEKKREKFARFYFLSNDELLEILSQTKEPTAVQPHLKKVFENIHQIEFDDQKKIHAMFSAEHEKIPFVKFVDPNRKNVEEWMGEVEEMMKSSVRQALLSSIQNYTQMKRTYWVINHPGQCVLNGSQVHWTKEVEDAIKEENLPPITQPEEGPPIEIPLRGVKVYWDKLAEQLNDLVELVVQDLTKQQQVTLNALIVIDVHAKDVVQNLFQSDVKDIGAFEWISQLRYYWESDDLWVKCIQTVFPYGYEYLGNTLRLVITPLTDKCYMTLMGALKLNLGGAPAGPAGTGKTESTKDLAKALAKQCVVFNCSDSMDYLMVGKFFKGLASAGAWCCFDEFNRINVEVLSVIAQQLLQLFGEKAKGTPSIEFEGSVIRLQPTFSVFITMNPGYAGRTELPDNLKALFRSVAMMVPDYAMIGEIMLYSFGFKKGRELANKMVVTFKLSSEQLSSQDHYDYGMRAVRSVINAAGLLKTAYRTLPEEQLLLRALRDVNVPKFLKDDIPLFENIICDLFPGVDRPVYEYGDLLNSIDIQCKGLNLQPVKSFVDKVLQLYDTIQVRHGLMLVGPTGGGKTANYTILQKSLTALWEKGFYKVHTHILNPKSITMGQLYGQFNEQTHEWTDGILAFIIRETVRDLSGEKHWIIFDGPVDAIWIESMNTVLDDNKKLCLNSGQILTLTPYMTMMFEVEDLAVASPATVSRCGMVYLEPVSMGVDPLIASWINKMPANIKKKTVLIKTLQTFFDSLLGESLEFLRKNCKEMIPTMDNNLVQSLGRILDCLMADFVETEIKKVSNEELEILEHNIGQFFSFALIWSVFATVDYESRLKLNTFFRQLLQRKRIDSKIPTEGTIYDYQYSKEIMSFVSWNDQIKNFEIKGNLQYHEITIPTNDSARNIYFKKLLITNKFNVMCPGPTGTGKSQNSYTLLTTGMGDDYQYVALTFSAQTGANQTQDTIDSKLDKRRKGVFGPPIGKKCIIFVDDLNMPKKEEYGAQPPIELIRQVLDHKGWYNRRELVFMKLEDLIFLTAMGPPGGGRSSITGRCVRHFNVIAYPELEVTVISQIFSSLVNHFFKKFSENVRDILPNLIQSVLDIYYKVREDLLPTPSKSHYTFNLRDIYRVFQGICSLSPKLCLENTINLGKIFYHENMRVFHDRLTTDDDRLYLHNLASSPLKSFNLEKDEVLNQERIIFADFLQGRELEQKIYTPVEDLNSYVKNTMETFQEQYNSDTTFVVNGTRKTMKLVMFLDACEHIARIARIIRQPLGNALLFGIGGSGRQSLSRMATFLSNYKLFQIEVIKNYNMRAWRDDIKKALMMAGVDNRALTFLFVDTQIISEQMLEDINNILNSGDVTGIYNEKDIEDIVQACKGDCMRKGLQPNKMNIYTQYLVRVKKNIHIVVAMSPIGEAFATRLRMFPSLINCSTIDWFTEWPEEALIGVGRGQLVDFETELKIEGKITNLVQLFKYAHKSVERISIQFKQELRRHNYVTPTSYLELLNIFKTILEKKNIELKAQILRLKSGLDKLNGANQAVEEMKQQLLVMQPELEEAQKETETMMQHIAIEQAQADEKQKIVAQEETEASKVQTQALEMQAKAEAAVEGANNTLETTLIKVRELKKDHLVEVKSLANPPEAVRVVLAAVVILLTDHIKRVGEIIITAVKDQIGKKEENYFLTAKSFLLNDPKELLSVLMSYDRNSINPNYIAKMERVCASHPKFNEKDAYLGSQATGYLFGWIKAMHDYYNIYIQTKPLREELSKQKKLVEEKTEELKVKKAALEEINSKIRELQALSEEKIKTKNMLTAKIKECELKLDRAQKLTEGLSDEKVRWSRDIEKLSQKGELYAGDSVIAACMLSYSGAFVAAYRNRLEQDWVNQLDIQGIKHTEGITMRAFLGDEVKIQLWNICGLPKDNTSIENGIIIEQSRRWPLMIDPQNQANQFIKRLGRETAEIEMIKVSDQQLMRSIELAIQFGKWILVESVGRDLDPSLEPILLQQVIKSGSSLSIQIGDKILSYNENFKFFMTTTLPNPHYSPETSVKVTLINFAITPFGLEEQMLAKIVELENPGLENRKNEIVRKNAQDKKELVLIEDNILNALSSAKGGIEEFLKDESLINNLSSSKKFAAEISQRVADSKKTEIEIDKSREGYRSVAFRASLLFFCIIELSVVDPMYQYSLQWFIHLFVMGVENAEPSTELAERLRNLNDFFTYSLYENVCRSLFENNKLIFSFLLTQRILQGSGAIDLDEWRYLLSGPTGEIHLELNPTVWIAENSWPEIYRQFYCLDQLPKFNGILKSFLQHSDEFKPLYDSSSPETMQMPLSWELDLDKFEKIILIKSLRPDKVIPAVQLWITEIMGQKFIIPPAFDLGKCYKDSTIMTPLIFVLSPGSDPVSDFLKFAEENNMIRRVETISLGQGQGPKAEKLVREGAQKGGWILLQNCHLATSWMPELEKLVEELDENNHKDFRLWLTSMPSPGFPVSVLQSSVKMTVEPPKGLRSNLLRSYSNLSDQELNSCKKSDAFKKLLFGFCLFHAIIQDRRKFGAIGWNIPYEFTNEDLNVCKKQLKLFLDDYHEIPFKVLNYLGAEINYGGRVTDDKDVRLIKTILKIYCCQDSLREGYKFSESGTYYQPPPTSIADYIKYIETLPLNPNPEAFGLHDNAEITNAQNETRIMLETLISMQPRAVTGVGKSREEKIGEIGELIQSKTPICWEIDAISKQYPTDYNESMNTVLLQELIRYNKLLEVMAISLVQIKKALKGIVVMSEELEKLANSLHDNQVPKMWNEKGHLSLKPLASWISDLNERVKFLNDWIKNGTPKVFWISGFYFPQAFITGTLQNYARKKFIAIDKLSFEFKFIDNIEHHQVTSKPEYGCYIHGIFLEGAKWDYKKHYISLPKQKELYSDLPLLHLVPIVDRVVPKDGIYNCPMYKVVSRAGTLSTTGHSTNFVMFLEMPTKENADVWIRGGVATFLALRY